MKLLKRLWLGLVFLTVIGSGLALVAAEDSSAPADFSLHVPELLADWVSQASCDAPTVLMADRNLRIAEAQYRADLARIYGNTFGLEAPIEANQRGVGSSLQFTWRKSLGETELAASIGVAEAHKWNEEVTVGPTLGLLMTHPLWADSSAKVARTEYALQTAIVRHRNMLRTWLIELFEAYKALHLAEIDANVANQKLHLAQQELDVTLLRATEGAASLAVLQAAKQSLVLNEAAAAAATLAVDRAQHRLMGTVGATEIPRLSGTSNVWTSATLSDLPVADQEAAWTALALEQNERVHLADQAIALAKAELAEVRQAAGPTGELRAGVAFPDTAQAEPQVGWHVGAQFRWPWYDSAASESITQAELRLEQAIADQAETLRQLRSDVTLAYQQAKLAEQIHGHVLEHASYSAHLLQVANDALAAGLGTELDVLRATIALAEAEKEVTAAYYDMIIKRAALWHTVGGDVVW